jgi:hypothetical protein
MTSRLFCISIVLAAAICVAMPVLAQIKRILTDLGLAN